MDSDEAEKDSIVVEVHTSVAKRTLTAIFYIYTILHINLTQSKLTSYQGVLKVFEKTM